MLYKIACIENSISAILTIRNGYLQKVTTESNRYINLPLHQTNYSELLFVALSPAGELYPVERTILPSG